MSTEREELEAMANDIYEHSRLRSAEADGLAVALSRLGYRKQEPVSEPTEAEVEAAFKSWNGWHVGTVRDRLRAALVAARAVTNPAVPVKEDNR